MGNYLSIGLGRGRLRELTNLVGFDKVWVIIYCNIAGLGSHSAHSITGRSKNTWQPLKN